MNPLTQHQLNINRRHFFGKSATGIGTAALSTLLGKEGLTAAPSGSKEIPDYIRQIAPKAKRVIYLFQNGAPTHCDLWDYKPKLKELHNTPVPESYVGGKRFSTMTGNANGKLLLAPVEPFKQYGQSGAWVSDFMPHIGAISDKVCFVKSMHTDAVNHAPGISFFMSGAQLPGRPTMGAWLSYGLGTMNLSLIHI